MSLAEPCVFRDAYDDLRQIMAEHMSYCLRGRISFILFPLPMSLDGGNPLRDFHYIFENITVPVYHHHSKSQLPFVQDVALSVQSAYPLQREVLDEVMQGDFGSVGSGAEGN
jgi:hypothetical protein